VLASVAPVSGAHARHQTTPAMPLGIAKHVWSIGELIDAALAAQLTLFTARIHVTVLEFK
jgi:hypothetical protein